MASSINPSNIDGTYPVAGQDNDSQGFRDNFTNIKTNFTAAKNEIESLQSGSAILSDENDFAFVGTITRAILKHNADSVLVLGTVGGAIDLDHSAGIIHTATLNSSSTLSFSNWPGSNRGGRVRFIVTINNIAHTLTLPGTVTLGTETIQGMSSLVITFPTTGTYVYDFSTVDNGASILVEDLTQSDTALGNIQINANTISASNTNGDIILTPDGTGTVQTDNLQLDGNTISSTDVDGNIILAPNGVGQIDIAGTTATIITSSTDQALTLSPNGTAAVDVPAGYKDRAGFGTNSLATKQYVDLTVSSGTIANIPLDHGTTINIGGATQANPVVITTLANHNLVDGAYIAISGVGGMTELNGNNYYADVLTTTTFALYSDVSLSTSVDGTLFTAYTTGGTAALNEQIDNGDSLTITGGTNIDVSIGTDQFVVDVAPTVTGLTSVQTDTLELNTTGTPTIQTPAASNANITVAPDGTGVVVIGGTAPAITTTGSSNLDLIIDPDGTGSIDLRGEIIVDSTIISPSTSNANISFNPDGTGTIQFIGNGTSISVTTNTNEDLVLAPNGTGTLDLAGGITTATSATAGTNGDVPTQVVGYIILKIGGSSFKVPYYNT